MIFAGRDNPNCREGSKYFTIKRKRPCALDGTVRIQFTYSSIALFNVCKQIKKIKGEKLTPVPERTSKFK